MAYEGLLDFQNPIRVGNQVLYYTYGIADAPFYVLPSSLVVATDGSGAPDFLLEKVRTLEGQAYGVLDMRVTSQYRLDDALIVARTAKPTATVQAAGLAPGFLRFLIAQDAADGIPANFLAPAPVSSDGLGTLRLVVRLTAEGLMLIERALTGTALPLSAFAEMEVMGVSPRIPLRVTFDPKTLLEHIGTDVVAREDVVSALLNREQVPATFTGLSSDVEPLALAAAMADRIRLRYGNLEPAAKADGKSYARLAAAVGGQVTWDLSIPEVVPRPLALTFDPLEQARVIIAQSGPDAVIRRTNVQPINTGFLSVLVSANLPAYRPNVATVGANLRVAANPPKRPQPISEAVEFAPPADRGGAVLRFSPTETQKYNIVPYAVVAGPHGTFSEFEGKPVPASGSMVTLYPNQFPVRFVPLEFAGELLEIASLTVVLSSGERFAIPDGVRAAAIALAPDAEDVTLAIEAAEKSTQGIVRFGPVAAGPLYVGLPSFREYGAHSIGIACEFADDVPLVALDLQVEGATEFVTVAFTRQQTHRDWSWTAKSPFHAGYRYRLHEAGEWSSIQPPFADLKISSKPAAVAAGG